MKKILACTFMLFALLMPVKVLGYNTNEFNDQTKDHISRVTKEKSKQNNKEEKIKASKPLL